MNGTPASGCLVPALNSVWAAPWSGPGPNSSGHQVAVKPRLMEEDLPPRPAPPHPQPSILQASSFPRGSQDPRTRSTSRGIPEGTLQAVRVSGGGAGEEQTHLDAGFVGDNLEHVCYRNVAQALGYGERRGSILGRGADGGRDQPRPTPQSFAPGARPRTHVRPDGRGQWRSKSRAALVRGCQCWVFRGDLATEVKSGREGASGKVRVREAPVGLQEEGGPRRYCARLPRPVLRASVAERANSSNNPHASVNSSQASGKSQVTRK